MKPTPDLGQAPSDLPLHTPMSFREFVLFIAALMALNALAIDIMLPALQEIGSALGVQDENRSQAILSAYLVGFGAGQLLIGTISDRFGRRSVLLWGLVVYVLAAALCSIAASFEAVLLGRVLQGLASAAPRVITISVVRDCYKGRRMASVMSLAMMVFMAVPVLAPSLGQLIILVAPWRGIFGLLTLYGLGMLLWVFGAGAVSPCPFYLGTSAGGVYGTSAWSCPTGTAIPIGDVRAARHTSM